MREALYQNFSQFGLLYRLHLGEGEEGAYFAYVQVTLVISSVGCRAVPHGQLFSITRRELQVWQGLQQDQSQGAPA